MVCNGAHPCMDSCLVMRQIALELIWKLFVIHQTMVSSHRERQIERYTEIEWIRKLTQKRDRNCWKRFINRKGEYLSVAAQMSRWARISDGHVIGLGIGFLAASRPVERNTGDHRRLFVEQIDLDQGNFSGDEGQSFAEILSRIGATRFVAGRKHFNPGH